MVDKKEKAPLASTLIDSISDEDWDNWDASNEMAIVADKDGLADPVSAEGWGDLTGTSRPHRS